MSEKRADSFEGKVNNSRRVKRTDRRIVKTQEALGSALLSLMKEKDFSDITVQDVLDRANVQRSTFYSHYLNKDDLFISDVEKFLNHFAMMLTREKAEARRLIPMSELLSHLFDMRELIPPVIKSGKSDVLQNIGVGIFAKSIEERLRRALPTTANEVLVIRAFALSGSMFALLNWWLSHGMKMPPQEIDDMFHTLAWNGLVPLNPERQ